MKQKYAPFFVFLLMFTAVSAQQDPKKTHFMFDMQSYNPAFSGSKPNTVCVTSLYHQQWYSFKDEHNDLRTGPGTQLVSINVPIPNSNNGLGLTVYNDGLGYERTLAFLASYARHFNLGATGRLGAGIGAGVMQKNLDGTKYRPIDPNDPLIPVSAVSDRTPDLSAGLFYRNAGFFNLYAGISATHIIPGKLSYETIGGGYTDYNLRTTGYFTAGASFRAMGGLLDIEPSILVKSDVTNTQFDLYMGVWYDKSIRLAAGTSFNRGTFVLAMIGYKLSPSLFLSYSLDVITSKKLLFLSPATHEILINYCFIFKEGGTFLTPRFLGGMWKDY